MMKPLLIFICLILCACSIDLKPADLDALQKDTIHVTVRGAVQSPQTMELPLYASVQQALDQAGTLETSDLSGINPEAILKDKDILTIPERTAATETGKVLINTATSAELQTLPGIGPSTAEKIIAYRTDHGLFQTLEDLMKVSGIGKARFEALKDLIGL
jgi:competence protein ComEA